MIVLITALTILVGVLLTAAGRYAAQRVIRPQVLEVNREMVNIFFGAVGLIYSLILAFALVSVWEDFEELRSVMRKEAAKMERIVHHAVAVDAATSSAALQAMNEYRQTIMGRGWYGNRRAQETGAATLEKLRQSIAATASNASNKDAVPDLLDDIDGLDELRVERLDHTTAHVPPLVWVVLIMGSIAVIIVSWLFTSSSSGLHLLLASTLVTLMLLCMIVLWRLDHPLEAYGPALLEEYVPVR